MEKNGSKAAITKFGSFIETQEEQQWTQALLDNLPTCKPKPQNTINDVSSPSS